MIETASVAAIVIGSGLSEALRPFPVLASLPYADLPGMPVPSVDGHDGVLKIIDVGGKPVHAFVGRSHLYEGVTTLDTFIPVRWMAEHGIQHVVFTNAAGGLDRRYDIGNIVLLSDVMDATMKPSIIAHPDVRHSTDVIDTAWRTRIQQHCLEHSNHVHDGVYVQVLGPSYETRAEIRMYRRMGAHVIGMSTAREARYAASLGMSVAGLSVVTNRLAEVNTPALDHAHVIAAGEAAAQNLGRILHSTIFAI